jgi:hypothetical protein
MHCEFKAEKIVWLRDKHGRIFHWPFDHTTHPKAFNSPADPLDVPAGDQALKIAGDVVTLDLPEGRITTLTNQNGRTGTCLRCGLCCESCAHLLVNSIGIGKPNATSCRVYAARLYEGYKGCILWPSEPIQIPIRLFGICGMRF